MDAPLAIVVAAGPGLGSAVAHAFARADFRVAVLSRRQAAMDALAAELGGGARGFAADAEDPAALEATLAEIVAAMGPPAVLVYNASRWTERPGLTLTAADLEADLRLCATGALVAAKAVAPSMEAAGGGTIIFTGSGIALDPRHGGPAPGLAAGKAAMRALALSLTDAFAGRGIHLATLTIAGTLKPGTAFDPERIAGAFLALHREPRETWSAETVYRGG